MGIHYDRDSTLHSKNPKQRRGPNQAATTPETKFSLAPFSHPSSAVLMLSTENCHRIELVSDGPGSYYGPPADQADRAGDQCRWG